jgi:hypothetical protein
MDASRHFGDLSWLGEADRAGNNRSSNEAFVVQRQHEIKQAASRWNDKAGSF